MNAHPKPAVDQWYRRLDKGQEFVVVAMDEDAETIMLQYFDGSLEEIDWDDWNQLEIEPVPEPENWSGPYDELYSSETLFTDTEMNQEEWNEPMDELSGRLRG